MAQRISPVFKNFVASTVLLTVAIVMLVSNTGGRAERGEFGKFSGNLIEWSVAGRDPFFRFSLEGNRADFRLDPMYFRDVLNRRVPSEFRKGARVTVTASRAELRNPTASAFSNVEIVWVRGIDVDGSTVLDSRSVEAADSANDRWGYALLVFAIGAFLYSFTKWQLPRLRSNRSLERTRGR
jgi:hypothetical protein